MRIQPILTISGNRHVRHERGYVYVYAGAQLKRYYWAGLWTSRGWFGEIILNGARVWQ